VVTQHQCQRARCPYCGVEQTGELAASAFGARLQAAVAALAIRNRVSWRDTVQLMAELFGARISTSSAEAILTCTADALELPHDELVRSMRSAGRPNMEETAWPRSSPSTACPRTATRSGQPADLRTHGFPVSHRVADLVAHRGLG
jgi:hypothetical protein